ncbi:MAG: hypothetical protein Ct9H300mP4_16860 [Gammaproteobacteria bacterium]|nr:MAG: hypothetical protein Ct9H300mP4_16860 [Gammaproteobacteria bacterium]
MVAFASSLDQAGILALSAEDTAIFLESMAGFDPLDSTSVEESVPQYSQYLEEKIKGKIIGFPKEFFDGSLASPYEALVAESIDSYKKLGIVFKEISLPNIGYSVPTYYVVAPAECSSKLARYEEYVLVIIRKKLKILMNFTEPIVRLGLVKKLKEES